MRGEKEDHYSCIILVGLKTSQMRQKYIFPYINWQLFFHFQFLYTFTAWTT